MQIATCAQQTEIVPSDLYDYLHQDLAAELNGQVVDGWTVYWEYPGFLSPVQKPMDYVTFILTFDDENLDQLIAAVDVDGHQVGWDECYVGWTRDPKVDAKRFKDVLSAAIPYFENVQKHHPDLYKMRDVAEKIASMYPLGLCDKLPRSTKPETVPPKKPKDRKGKMRKLNEAKRLANKLKRL